MNELACLQGLSEVDFPWRAAGLRESASLVVVDAAMSFTVVDAILPRLLYMSRLINLDEFNALVQ